MSYISIKKIEKLNKTKPTMTTLTTTNGKYLAVNVPEGATKFNTHFNNLIWSTDDTVHAGNNISLPPGKYELIGLSDSMTEDQAAMVVDNYKGDMSKYAYYENGDTLPGFWCEFATYSFASLLRSHNVTGRVAILKVIDNKNEEK